MTYLNDDSGATTHVVDLVARAELKRWLGRRRTPFGSDPASVLLRLQDLASALAENTFDVGLEKVIGVAEFQDIHEMIGKISNALFNDVGGSEREILSKSLHE